MSRIDDLITELAPKGVQFKTLGEIAELVRGNGMPKVDLTDEGVGAIHYGQIYTRYGVWTTSTLSFVAPETATKLAKVNPGDVIITNTSENVEDVGKAVAWLGEEQIVTGGHATVIRHHEDPKYLSYWFQSVSFFAQKKALATGTKVIDVSAKQLAKIRIPVPPLEIQREIVAILDELTQQEAELESNLESEAASRQVQHAHYRKALLSRANVHSSVSLSELVEFTNGKPHERLVDPEGEIALLTARFVSTSGRLARFVRREDALTPARVGDIAMVMSDLPNGRALARCFYVDRDHTFTANQRVCLLRVRDTASLSQRYLYHYLNRNPQLLAHDNEQDQTHLKKGEILGVQVPLLPVADQIRIVDVLDEFDSLVNELDVELRAELSARCGQYEHYRDRLLTFEEAIA